MVEEGRNRVDQWRWAMKSALRCSHGRVQSCREKIPSLLIACLWSNPLDEVISSMFIATLRLEVVDERRRRARERLEGRIVLKDSKTDDGNQESRPSVFCKREGEGGGRGKPDEL